MKFKIVNYNDEAFFCMSDELSTIVAPLSQANRMKLVGLLLGETDEDLVV